MSKVYLLEYEHGEYSDYQRQPIGIFSSAELAEKRKADILAYLAERRVWTDKRLLACEEAGYGAAKWQMPSFWKNRSAWWKAWTEKNPAPEAPSYMNVFIPWDAEWEITEYTVDA